MGDGRKGDEGEGRGEEGRLTCAVWVFWYVPHNSIH